MQKNKRVVYFWQTDGRLDRQKDGRPNRPIGWWLKNGWTNKQTDGKRQKEGKTDIPTDMKGRFNEGKEP